MKKGLLLSVIASTMIFAGGEISPVDVPAPAADCSDFSGKIGVYYNTIDNDLDNDNTGLKDSNGNIMTSTDGDLFGKNTSELLFAANLHVEKEIVNGLGFGVSVGGWTTTLRDTFTRGTDGSALGELYLSYNAGDTGVMVGRFGLGGSVSPLASTDDKKGVINHSFEGVLVTNSSIADTSVYGVWLSAAVDTNTRSKFLNVAGDNAGIFAFGVKSTAVENTTISAVGYFAPEFNGGAKDTMAGVLTVGTSFSGLAVKGQVAYIDQDTATDATISTALNISKKLDFGQVWAQAEYINDGDYALNPFGAESLMGDAGLNTTAIKAGISGVALGAGKAYLSAEYRMDNDTDKTSTIVDLGYAITVSGVTFAADYEYVTRVLDDGTDGLDSAELDLSATYKF